MDCTEFLYRYSDFDDSLLTPGEEARFRAHLEACDACTRYDRVLRKGRMLARQVAAPEPSSDFLPRLQHRLLASSAPQPVSPGPLAAGGFLTLTLAAIMGLWLFGAERPLGPFPSGGGSVHFHDADPSDRPLALPMLALGAWEDEAGARVDRRVSSSYSPLVTGPPAYRVQRSGIRHPSTATRLTLD